MSKKNLVIDLRFHLYVFISLLLVLPLILRPMAPLLGWNSSFNIDYNLGLSASLLLVVVVVMDSIVADIDSYRLLLFHTLWIIFGFIIFSIALYSQYALFLLGLFFCVHTFRSALPLWRGRDGWWYWPAWLRDVFAAVILFGWAFLVSM